MKIKLNDGKILHTHNDYLGNVLKKYNGMYFEFDSLNFLKKKYNFNTVIDIGANIGNHSLFFSDFSEKIYSIEPIKETYEILVKNININKLDKKIYPLNYGINKENGKMTYNKLPPKIDKLNIINYGSYMLNEYISDSGVEIDVVTLDYLVKSENIVNIDFIKIDIEGMVMNVLNGSVDTLKKHKPILFIECKDITNVRINVGEVLDFLKVYGYKIIKSFNERDHLFST